MHALDGKSRPSETAKSYSRKTLCGARTRRGAEAALRVASDLGKAVPASGVAVELSHAGGVDGTFCPPARF